MFFIFSFKDKLLVLQKKNQIKYHHLLLQIKNIFIFYPNKIHEKLSKGVSILYYQLPYPLLLILSCPITSNSKAA